MSARGFIFWSTVMGLALFAGLWLPEGDASVSTLEHSLGPVVETSRL